MTGSVDVANLNEEQAREELARLADRLVRRISPITNLMRPKSRTRNMTR